MRAVVVAAIVLYLLSVGLRQNLRSHAGWPLIVIGFGFVFLGTVVDITDNYESLNRFVIIGDTEFEAFFEKVVGYLVGLTLVAAGFWRWLPEIAARRKAETELQTANNELQQRYAQLRDARAQASTDALTGLSNHRAFHETVRREMTQAQQGGTSLSLIMLDVDDFKQVNDSLGHLAGDRLLRAVGAAVDGVVGGAGTYRYGGDEFAVILPGHGHLEAVAVAGKALKAVQLAMKDGASEVTISLGVASFPDTADSLEELLYGADIAMYEAKAAGKDRVVSSRGTANLEDVA